jgi:hypothetical protein
MKIYLAGTSVSSPRKEKKIQQLFKKGHKLHSFFHCVDGFESKWFKMNKKNKVNLFLDSGAFSAKTQGVEIDIKEYISFIKQNKDIITVYANLDVIGNPDASLKNLHIMEKAGLYPLPVFHYGEDPEKYLVPLLLKYKYIALGGLVIGATPKLISWLDTIFKKYLTDKAGMPIVKVHGFGLTNFVSLLRYPWYSVDSTSWVITGRVGSIFIPILRNNEWVYSKPPLKIAVSTKSPSLKNAGQHIDTLSPRQKNVLLFYLKEHDFVLGKSKFKKEKQTYELKENEKWCGKKPKDKTTKREIEIIIEPGISNTYQLRDELNIQYYLELEKNIPKWPWAFKIFNLQNRMF